MYSITFVKVYNFDRQVLHFLNTYKKGKNSTCYTFWNESEFDVLHYFFEI